MKAKTIRSKAPAKATKPAAKRTSVKAVAKPARPAKPAKAAKASEKKPAAKAAKPAKAAPALKVARPVKAETGVKPSPPPRPGKPAAARPSVPRPQLVAQRRREYAHFRDLLLGRQREQTQAYAASKQDSESHLDNGTEDYIDYAVNSYAREFLLSLTEMDRKQLLQIEDALRRIDRGEYGRCQQCGTEIPRKRLEIQPWARHCVACQELEEKGLLPQFPFHPGEEGFDADDEPEAAPEEEFEAEPEVEEPEEEEPVLDDEPLVVDAEDTEE